MARRAGARSSRRRRRMRSEPTSTRDQRRRGARPDATRAHRPRGSSSGGLRCARRACSSACVERQARAPSTVSNAIFRTLRQRGMLDDHDRQVARPATGSSHPEHDDRLVDDHELQRQLLDEPGLLAGLDEASHASGERGVVERARSRRRCGPCGARDLEPLDVLLRRRRVRRLGEDEDLVLDARLELGEALVDRARGRAGPRCTRADRCAPGPPRTRASARRSCAAALALERRRAACRCAATRRSTAVSGGDAAYLTTAPAAPTRGPSRPGCRARRRCADAAARPGGRPAPR